MPIKKPVKLSKGFYYFTSILDFCQDGFIEEISTNSFTANLKSKVYKVYFGPNVYILKSLSCDNGSTDFVTDAKKEYAISNAMSQESSFIAAPIDMKDWVDESSGEIYVEMLFEYGGESLLSYFKQISSTELMEIIRQTVSAFATMQKHGIFHSDIKLDNFVIKDGTVKVIDFGVSQELKKKTFLFKTSTGPIKGGTLPYLPPEVFLDASSKMCFGPIDVYSWGISMYQLITGKTIEQLGTECELYKKPGKDYNGFLQIVKELKIKGDNEGFQSKIISDVLLKVLDYNPKNRPSFDVLLDIFGQPLMERKSKKIGSDADTANLKNKLKKVQDELLNSRIFTGI